MRRDRASSALSTAVPAGGSASTSSRLPSSMASSEPARSRCAPRTAVTTPMLGIARCSQGRDVAGHVHAHLEHGGLVLRTQPQQRQRQADLVVLVASLRSIRQRAARTSPLLLGGRLGQRAGDADHERREAVAPGAGRRPAQPGRPRRRMIATSWAASAFDWSAAGGAVTMSAAAPAAPRRPGSDGRRCARRGARRTPGPIRRAGSRRPRP